MRKALLVLGWTMADGSWLARGWQLRAEHGHRERKPGLSVLLTQAQIEAVVRQGLFERIRFTEACS
jgi:hypothetical protein